MLATPEPIKDWSLTSLKEKLIKIGAKVVSHGRYVAFQLAEVAIPRNVFADILRLIAELRPPPVASRSLTTNAVRPRTRVVGAATDSSDDHSKLTVRPRSGAAGLSVSAKPQPACAGSNGSGDG